MPYVGDLTAVRKALAAAAATVPLPDGNGQLRGIHYPVAQVNPPQFAVWQAIYDLDSAGPNTVAELKLTCRLFAGTLGSEAFSTELLDKLMAPAGAYSVVAAIQADHTLGGVATQVRCERWAGPGVFTLGDTSYIAGVLELAVF